VDLQVFVSNAQVDSKRGITHLRLRNACWHRRWRRSRGRSSKYWRRGSSGGGRRRRRGGRRGRCFVGGLLFDRSSFLLLLYGRCDDDGSRHRSRRRSIFLLALRLRQRLSLGPRERLGRGSRGSRLGGRGLTPAVSKFPRLGQVDRCVGCSLLPFTLAVSFRGCRIDVRRRPVAH
jgi:hypothetical protein